MILLMRRLDNKCYLQYLFLCMITAHGLNTRYTSDISDKTLEIKGHIS